MRLLDCFIELIAYMAFFIRIVQSEQPDFDQVKADINQLINKSQQHLHRGRFSQNEFDLAQFAVFAWIDEALLNSSWQAKNRWQGEQLQRQYYQTVDAGELFFDRLNALEPTQTEVREVYYLCLALGFSGRFCNPGDGVLLEQLKISNLKLITGPVVDMKSFENSSLFSGAYQAEDSLNRIERTSGKRFPIEIFAGVGVPVLLYGLLFLIYRFILDNVGQNFISMVP
jgi:type VI secretion system protein ImpK